MKEKNVGKKRHARTSKEASPSRSPQYVRGGLHALDNFVILHRHEAMAWVSVGSLRKSNRAVLRAGGCMYKVGNEIPPEVFSSPRQLGKQLK